MNKPALFVPAREKFLLDTILHSTADAIICLSPAGQIEQASAGAEKMFGYKAGQLAGQHISRLIISNNIKSDFSDSGSWNIPANVFSGSARCGDGKLFPIRVTIANGGTQEDERRGCVFFIQPDLPVHENTRVGSKSYDLANLALEHVEGGFVMIDTAGRIQLFNNYAFVSIVLNQQERKVQLGASILDYIAEERRGFFQSVIDQVLDGKPFSYERPFTDDRGREFWFHFTLNPVKEKGLVTGICITGNDITRLKQAEEKAERNERRFRSLVEKSGEAFSILSSNIELTYISPSVERMLGYTIEELLAIDFTGLVHPDDMTAVVDSWKEMIGNPGCSGNGHSFRIKNKKGEWRWISGTFTNLVHDEAISGIVHNFRDITESIEARNELLASEERYRYLFYNNPEPMWIFEPHTLKFLEVNHAAIDKYGYSRREFLQLSLLDIRDAEDAGNLWRSVTGRLDKQYNQSGTWKHYTKDRKLLYVNISSHSFRFKGTDAVLVLVNDVTEKTRADQLLLKAYDEKQKILESITDGFLTVDNNWHVTSWNREAEAIFGITREQILGKNMWEVYDQPLPNRFYTEYTKALKDQVKINFEELVQTFNVWLDITAYPSREGLAIYFKDITEKKLTQEKIRVTKERYEMVAKATNDAIYEWDIVNNVTFWGEGFQTLFGHPRTEEAMPSTSWLENLHPDEGEAIKKKVDDAFSSKQESLSREMRFRCFDGSYKTVFDKLQILYDDQGKPVKLVGAMQDITARKESEVAVQSLNQELNRRAEELVRSNEELERFAYVASHDLQEPLRMVGSFLQLLQKKYGDQLDATAHQYIEFAVDGSLRMKRLINDLLEYARVGTNKDEFKLVDMNIVVSELLKDFKDTAGTEVFTLTKYPEIRGSRHQLAQLMHNLVSNSLKYNNSDSPKVEIGCRDAGSDWEFFVKDNGIGIEEKFLEKVFVIFQRLHNKTQYPGTGIGLAICKKIVERHGGRIWIESTPGEGSCFYYTIKK